jgi:NAD+ kinase
MATILGGDGTLLRAQSRLNPKIPIFGINMGTVGFLTEIEVKHTFDALKEILKGDYYKEKRTRLVVSHENHNFTAMNEVVVMTEKPAKMLHFEIKVDGETIEEVRADGLIVSTPSGSTAYAMSAGGPIVDPKVAGFVIIPICPYKLGVRPFVVSDNSEITVKQLKKGKSAVFVMDGQINEEADYGEEITFKKSDKDAYFIRTSSKYFYEKVKDKLQEGGIESNNRCNNE